MGASFGPVSPQARAADLTQSRATPSYYGGDLPEA